MTILKGSLTEPIKDQIPDLKLGEYDRNLILCIEVAEHIDGRHANQIVENITEHTGVLVFSAAYPGQGGWGHVNEQPWSHWAYKFNHYGFFVNKEITKEFTGMMKKRKVHKWYWKNIRVLERIKV